MWSCRVWRSAQHVLSRNIRCSFGTSRVLKESISSTVHPNESLSKIRNIGIIAHIDAGKTTTTERMLYYSGSTRRIGDVDDGSTVTDFLPAERARGITIQSAAVTFHWPPLDTEQETDGEAIKSQSHPINLIDTPGHADFTFEVIRSLRILDGAVCILDGVAGVEAQTEKVWRQASNYKIPRLVYVNKLDRDGASFNNTVKDVASKLSTWPMVCQIPWWNEGKLIGIGDAVNFQALLWKTGGDGRHFDIFEPQQLEIKDKNLLAELKIARKALGEALCEHDDILVEEALNVGEDWERLTGYQLWSSLRRVLLNNSQTISPIFAGASFRNIGVQPLLDAVNSLLPAPTEAPDPDVSVDGKNTFLSNVLDGTISKDSVSKVTKPTARLTNQSMNKVTGCALAFKVVNDATRGVLVYIRVYTGSIKRGDMLFDTTLGVSERAQRLFRMYADDAQPINSIDEGQIGVISGLQYARTGDTLLVYSGMGKSGPPAPMNSLQLRPIDVPPPLWYVSLEPHTLSDEKHMRQSLDILLREDPSLKVSTDTESGQTHLAGMGELHLEIARDRLIQDLKVRATVGKIAIGYREAITSSVQSITETVSRESAGKMTKATCTASVQPVDLLDKEDLPKSAQIMELDDANILTVTHTYHFSNNRPTPEHIQMANNLSLADIITAYKAGVSAALSRGPSYALPLHSTHVSLHFDPETHLDRSATTATLASAARQAVFKALRASTTTKPCVLMEPVMNASIAVPDSALGEVAQDLTSSRGATIISLGEDDADAESSDEVLQQRLTPAQLARVYAPRDPFQGNSDDTALESGGARQQQIKARVPLREMVGYLNRLRSLTAGRGTFVMSIDRFEKMGSDRMKSALADIGVIQ